MVILARSVLIIPFREYTDVFRSHFCSRQKMCSRECQTGASVVNGQRPYKQATKRDRETSAQHNPDLTEKDS